MALWKTPSNPERESAPAGTPPQAPDRPVEPRARRGEETEMANIGKSITIKGEVTGDEDLVVEGRVEGRFDLKNHHLTIGTNGDVKAEVSAKAITVIGRVTGNITATERIEIRETGRVDGDLVAPRLLVQEGAQVNGAITMKPQGAAAGAPALPSSPRLEPAKKAM